MPESRSASCTHRSSRGGTSRKEIYLRFSTVIESVCWCGRSTLAYQSCRRQRSPTASMAEMPVEECGDLAKRLLGLGHAIVELVLSVRLTLVDFELRVDAGLAKLPVHPHRVAQQQVACSRGQDRGRKAVHISVEGE